MSATMTEKEVYTVNEVAAILRVHRMTVGNLISEGKLEAFHVGREWRIRREALERFMNPKPSDQYPKEHK